MAKFQFRLTTLQKLREAHRDEMRSKLAEAYQAEQLLEQQVNAVRAEETQLLETQRQSFGPADTDVNRLLNVQRYAAVLKGQLAAMQNQATMLATEIEKRRQALIEADQQVQVLEKLHERQLDAHRTHIQRTDAKALDEIASTSWRPDH